MHKPDLALENEMHNFFCDIKIHEHHWRPMTRTTINQQANQNLCFACSTAFFFSCKVD